MIRRRKSPKTADAPRLASYPDPYPEGWYRLALSKSVRRGDIRYLECLGRQFVIWREENSDDVHVMDAFCPHLGANLAFGRVRGDCLECPLHEWQFTGDGRVGHIPYSDNPPERTFAQTVPVEEVHGQIFIYARGAGSKQAASDPPPYHMPRIREVDDGRFVLRGDHNVGGVRMHIVEVAENAVDTAHFQPLHRQFRIPWTPLRVPGVEIEHTIEWTLDPEYSWKMHLIDDGVLKLFGRRLGRTTARARASYIGIGSVTMFRFSIPGQGEIEMYQTVLPLGPLDQQVDFRWFADRNMSRLLVWYVIGNWVSQFGRDVEIWENKIYRAQPKLCRDDGPFFPLRRWYQQFLSDAPPSAFEPSTRPDQRSALRDHLPSNTDIKTYRHSEQR